MAQSLKGKVAFVTGAGRGIGRAIAIALAHEGVNVGLFARTEGALKEVATEIEGIGVKVAYAAVDVSSLEQVQQGIGTLTNELGPADILINNAGIGKFAYSFRNGSRRMEENYRRQYHGYLLCYSNRSSTIN